MGLPMYHTAFIGLGSNLENPRSQLQRAFAEFDELPETRLATRSSLYRSAPMGYLDQPEFVNAVAKIETALTPQALLQELLGIEHRHGRERTFRNAPRTLDLDILLYGDAQLHEHGLTIPHPQMHLRPFVLQPLLEIAPEIGIPGMGQAIEAFEKCRDKMLEMLPDAA
ncbi:MAG: 2-amino-4-hydroxy-6-hydroxymethyldihydropteridine diphosphokinase [Gallionella sp.]|nr:2-amino-4-hydroxy-6-hydroxymethyldihydropteridine diphosphokinase [Gallionella sp.]